jgi:hypothetical protein
MLVPAGAPITSGAASNVPPTIWLCPPAPNKYSVPAGCPTTAMPTYPYYSATPTTTWNLIDGYLRVEYLNNSGQWVGVTNEWLGLGFARGLTPPTMSYGGTPAGGTANLINPQAILLLQEPADRRGNGVVNLPNDHLGIASTCSSSNFPTTACSAWTNASPPEFQVDSYMPSPAPTTSASPWFGLYTGSETAQSVSMYNWYPINFYDAREGEPRDTDWGNNSCTSNGVMNAVEIDVGNLQQWLAGKIGSSGTSVNYSTENGYVLYYSDRRGMLPNPNYGSGTVLTGDSGLEDVINSSSASGTPDGKLQAIPAGQSLSPEDVNENNALDNFGINNLGLGFYNITQTATTTAGTSGNPSTYTFPISASTNMNSLIVAAGDPYGTASASHRIQSCGTTGRKNWVSGARHVLRLVDGAYPNVPITSNSTVVNGVTYSGGFTVASENPVYIMGNYNSNANDTFFTGASGGAPGADLQNPAHSAASIIADSVTILSNNWANGTNSGDLMSMVGSSSYNNDITMGSTTSPGGPYAGDRIGATTYYRVAIAGGKNMAFPFPSWENATDYGFGTDGGIHNFLRFLEDWTGQTLNYGGSLVSLYYATYNTGIFKCCQYSVYSPPVRNYLFDTDFEIPAGLPPGTPMFRDLESLGYRQLFATRTSSQ